MKGSVDKSVVIGTDELPFDATVRSTCSSSQRPHAQKSLLSSISYGVCIIAGYVTEYYPLLAGGSGSYDLARSPPFAMASAMAVDMADLDCLVEPGLVATLWLFEYSTIRARS